MRHIENHVSPKGVRVELFIVHEAEGGNSDAMIEASYYTERGVRGDKVLTVTAAQSDQAKVELHEELGLDLLRYMLDKVNDWRDQQNEADSPE